MYLFKICNKLIRLIITLRFRYTPQLALHKLTFGALLGLCVFGVQWAPSLAWSAPKCVIFVHGHRQTDETSYNYKQVEDYWTGRKMNFFGFETGSKVGNGIAAATDRDHHYSYLVNYDSTQPYYKGAKSVARQIHRAMLGLPDAGGVHACPTQSSAGGPMIYVVVAHSMGGVVMDFILGNATESSPYFDYEGAPFSQVSKDLAYVMTIGTPHVGSYLADAMMKGHYSFIPGPHNLLLNALSRLYNHRDKGTEWLQTAPNYQVSKYMTDPIREFRLYGGWKLMATSAYLSGDDDGVSTVTTMYACSGDPKANRRLRIRTRGFPFYDLPVCDNSSSARMGGFSNYQNKNWSSENHLDQIRDIKHLERSTEGLPGGRRCLRSGSFMEEVACTLGR
jgi:hypothetical protein